MSTARTISNRLPRQIALAAIVAGVVAISGSSASAGVMLPWIDNSGLGQSATAIDFSADVAGASSRVEIPAKNDQPPCERGECPSQQAHVVDALGGSNGASAPVSSASGQTSQLVAFTVQSPIVAQTPACASRHLRERSLQLPHPPLGELLDPPKLRG